MYYVLHLTIILTTLEYYEYIVKGEEVFGLMLKTKYQNINRFFHTEKPALDLFR